MFKVAGSRNRTGDLLITSQPLAALGEPTPRYFVLVANSHKKSYAAILDEPETTDIPSGRGCFELVSNEPNTSPHGSRYP
jgi:hypothetical protein